MHKNGEVWTCDSRDMLADIQTDMLITILHTHIAQPFSAVCLNIWTTVLSLGRWREWTERVSPSSEGLADEFEISAPKPLVKHYAFTKAYLNRPILFNHRFT